MSDQRQMLLDRFHQSRALTESLAAPLSEADQQLQSMPLASPTKWHRAHTSWFYEAFVLQPAGIEPHDPRFGYLFNSYYDSLGERVARHKRGLMSRPSAAEIGGYRRTVDERVLAYLAGLEPDQLVEVAPRIELGIAHEQQHQELLLTDILNAFYENPLAPAYRESDAAPAPSHSIAPGPVVFRAQAGGVVEIGHRGSGFCFDNEQPRHRVHLNDYALADRLVSVGDVKAFISAGGYGTPSLWLSQGFELGRAHGWRAPGYARLDDDGYAVFTLRGWHRPADDEPASHLSYWEADAIARFFCARLPTEAEWEHATTNSASGATSDTGNFADGPLRPRAALNAGPEWFGNVWQWTRSSYDAYPGYRAAQDSLGEYNGKFMAQQMVLRGGSCLTPRGHMRASYRNFWPPDTRFQMTGLRLARDT